MIRPKQTESPDLRWAFGTHLVEQAHLWLGHKPLYDWQIDTLVSVEQPGSRCGVSCANEAGKSKILAPTVLLGVASAWRGAVCYATSASERQVKEQIFEKSLVPIAEHYKWGIRHGDMKITLPNGSSIMCYVCSKATDVEGFHAGWEFDRKTGEMYYAPLAYYLDECKGIDDMIHTEVRRTVPTFMLAASTPPENRTGWFYNAISPDHLDKELADRRRRGIARHSSPECFTEPNPLYEFPGEFWTYRRIVTWEECPHLHSRESLIERENWIRIYGLQSPFVQSSLFGRFISAGGANMIYQESDLELLKRSMARDSEFAAVPGDIRAAADTSGGGDDMILMIRSGTELLDIDLQDCLSDIEQAEYIVRKLKSLNIPPWAFTIDGGGIGATLGNLMEQRLGFYGINRFLANNDPTYNWQFKDRYTEIHFAIKELLMYKALIIPWDDLLIRDFRERRYVSMEGDRIKTEPKNAHRAREGYSPDRLDTLVYLFQDFPMESWRRGKATALNPQQRERETETPYESRFGDEYGETARSRAFGGLRKTPSLAEMRKH